MRLGMLGRTVVVLSAFWMVGATLYFANQLDLGARESADISYQLCTRDPQERTDCWDIREADYGAYTDGLWLLAAGRAAIILSAALLAFAVLYWSGRWIAAGRRRD